MKLTSFCLAGSFSAATFAWQIIEFTHTIEFIVSLPDARIIRSFDRALASRSVTTALILLLATLSVLLLAIIRTTFRDHKSMPRTSVAHRQEVFHAEIIDETEEIETEMEFTIRGIKKSSKFKRTRHQM